MLVLPLIDNTKWVRTATVLSPTNAGDDVTTTGTGTFGDLVVDTTITISSGSIEDSGGTIDFGSTHLVTLGDITGATIGFDVLQDNSLKGYWQAASGQATALDSSVNGNDGSFQGNAAATNDVFEFDGSGDYIDCGTGLSIIGSEITISVWIKPILASVWTSIVGIDDATHAYNLNLRNNNQIRFLVYTSAGNNESRFAATNNVWQHVVGVYDGSLVKLYVNGILKDSDSLTGNITASANAFKIAQNWDGDYEGKIDEVMVFDRALPIAEIQQLYEQGNKRFGHFNELHVTTKAGIGTTAPDRALEINHATGGTLRLTYNDANGSATNYVDLLVTSGGNLSITASGNTVSFDDETFNLGLGEASDTVINFLGDSNNGSITWDESDNEFDFGSALLTTTGASAFGATTITSTSTPQLLLVYDGSNSFSIDVEGGGGGVRFTASGGDFDFDDDNMHTTGTFSAGASDFGDGGTTNYLEVSATGDVVFHGSGGLAFGTCYGNHIGWSQANAVQNTWYNIADADMISGPLNNVAHDGNGKLTVTSAGMYHVTWSCCFEDNVANDHIEIGIEVSGSGSATAAGQAHLENKFASEEEHSSSSTILDLAASATLEVAIRTTDAGTPTISVQGVNLTAIQVGGT